MEFKIGDKVFHTKYKKTYTVAELFEGNVTLLVHLEGVGEFEMYVMDLIKEEI